MTAVQIQIQDSLAKRILLLYGLHAILSNASYLIGYYLLPEGFMRGAPQTFASELAAKPESFGLEFALTLLFNFTVIVLAVVCNFNQVRGIPAGYAFPVSLGVVGGLIAGTNSFVADDLSRYSVREGMALALSVGGLEMLGYILIIAATVKLGVYQYQSWWRWHGKWKATKIMSLRDVRLSRPEMVTLALGLLLVVFAAYRETAMAMNLPVRG